MHPLGLLRLLVLVLLPAGAALAHPAKQTWLPVARDHWQNMVAHGGVTLTLRDGTTKFIPARVMGTVLKVKDRLEAVSGQAAELALVHTQQPNAYALVHAGRPVIALSLTYLEYVGSDPDVLAATFAHELAHLRLQHSGERRHALGVMPEPGDYGVGDFEPDSLARDEERAADRLGLQWSGQAGFDPCGQVRLIRILSAHISAGRTHPDLAERIAAANEAARQTSGGHCE